MSDAQQCPHCGRPIPDDAETMRTLGEFLRYTCAGCGLQLVRRPGRPWAGIRG